MSTEPRSNRSPQFRDLIEVLKERRANPPGSLEEGRRGFESFALSFADPPAVHRQAVDVDGVPGEWSFLGSEPALNSVVLYLHGGGYTIGSIPAYHDLSARIAHQSAADVLTIDYRLAPEHKFPAAVEDAMTAFRWLRERVPPKGRIVVAGDSAGGGLAIALLVALRDAGESLPTAAAVVCPKVDHTQTGSSIDTQAPYDPTLSPEASYANGLMYLGEAGDLAHPLASPIYADLHGLPPVHVHVGTAEILLDDGLRLARKLRDAGVDVDLDVWPEGIHILPFFASKVPEAESALATITDFLRQHLHAQA